ncbi:hypothetical protein PIROE2DRAFT_4966 [Piromyces sp. E2]|nr:hypothetical protein PIROE2DRAFT_4966 [Piromyces sp. E2]|eukprot:OUM67562.1 hypothetical protein PIROE2DRAFT_4966 [Piromyces sp. E2]
MLGIGTDKNYRKACQFLKAAAHQKDVESMVSLAEGYGNGTFPLQEEYSDDDDYPEDEEVSSESDSSIRFSSDSSISSDGSFLSDDNTESDIENNNLISNSLNKRINDTTKKTTQPQVNLNSQILPSPNKKIIPFTNSKKNSLTTTPTKSYPITPPKSNIKKSYRRRISLLNFSFHYRKMAAKYGHLNSIKFIAKAYDFGSEEMKITHNSHLAQKYYTIAAKEYEDIDSLRRLGDMYYYHDENKPNDKNKVISFNYYQKAALLGDLKSSERVAHCLYYGEGVSQNIQNAYKLLLDIAEKNSDGQLMKYIGDEYYYGTDTVISNSTKNKDIKEQMDQNMIKPDISLAFEYYYKAVKMKNASACVTVGNHHFIGIPKYLKSDPKKAVEYYEQAVDLGDYSVIKLIADCYLFGIGVKKNVEKAKNLYEKLKENGLWEGEMPSPDMEIDFDF